MKKPVKLLSDGIVAKCNMLVYHTGLKKVVKIAKVHGESPISNIKTDNDDILAYFDKNEDFYDWHLLISLRKPTLDELKIYRKK